MIQLVACDKNSWNISIESVYRGMTMIRRGIRNDTACCL